MDISRTGGGILRTINQQNNSQEALSKTLARLSSGRRLNSAADGAAELSVATQLSANVRSLAQAERNTLDGVSILQTADSGLEQQQEVTGRLRELAIQASNGTLSDDQRSAIQTEANSLTEELDRIASTTEFNGQPVLDGGLDTSLQTGPNAENTTELSVGNTTNSGLGITAFEFGTPEEALASLDTLDEAQVALSSERANVGAQINNLESQQENLRSTRQNLVEARSRIEDADVAETTSQFVAQRIRNQAGIAALAQGNVGEAAAGRLIRGTA